MKNTEDLLQDARLIEQQRKENQDAKQRIQQQ